MELLNLFTEIDDFCKEFEAEWERQMKGHGLSGRRVGSGLVLSEVVTILVWFHQSGYRIFKWFYVRQALAYHRRELPKAVSYSRFVELMPQAMLVLSCM